MYRVMESAFPRGADRYSVEKRSEKEIIQGIIDGACALGLDKVAALYGVKTQGGRVVNVRSVIPVGYALPKGKMWGLQEIKGRPISPHTKHVLKRVSNRVGRAHHVVLTTINTMRQARMFTTHEYKSRLIQDYVRVLNHVRAKTGDPELGVGSVHRM